MRLLSPAALAARCEQPSGTRKRVSRVAVERAADAERRREGRAAIDAERAERGLPPVDLSATRRKFVDLYVPPVRHVAFGPVLPGSRLVDKEALAAFGVSDAANAVYLEHARHFFCRNWIDGADFSVSAAGLHLRPDLWPDLGQRVDRAEQDSRARINRIGRAGTPKNSAVP